MGNQPCKAKFARFTIKKLKFQWNCNDMEGMDEDNEPASDPGPLDEVESHQKMPCSSLTDSFESQSKLVLKTADSFCFDTSFPVRAGNYGRGCKWSPDGLCLLTCSQDHKLRLFEIPPTDKVEKSCSPDEKDGCHQDRKNPWEPVFTMTESGTIYDFAWYPKMNSSLPDTCFLAATAQNQPIHLYDAYNGSLTATFRCYNHVDEVAAASCLAFDPHGQKLYAGLKNEIRIFNVDEPCRECVKRTTYNKKEGGVGGIVSCIAFNPAMPQVYAIGSYGRDLGVYLEPTPHTLCFLDGQKGGITHLQFSSDGTKLCAGGRKDDEILVWDLRNPGRLYTVLDRKVETNQRIYFDVLGGSYVASGSTDGTLTVWDLNSVGESSKLSECHVGSAPFKVKPRFQEKLKSDCINGVSLHPTAPYIAVTCGQRRLDQNTLDSSEDESEHPDKVIDTIENSLSLLKVNTMT